MQHAPDLTNLLTISLLLSSLLSLIFITEDLADIIVQFPPMLGTGSFGSKRKVTAAVASGLSGLNFPPPCR